MLRRHAGQGAETEGRAGDPPPPPRGKARTTFQIARLQDSAKCLATNGRLEGRLRRDFSTIDRRRLEAAGAEMLAQLD